MSAPLLSQVLVLLFASVVVVAVARRQGLPPILGYLVVGLLLGPLAFGVLLFQDLAVVPLLALATALAKGDGAFTGASMVSLAVEGLLALVVVLAIGRWLLRPLFYEIAHSRLRELFTLTVLLVVLSCAWITQRVGLSMALGAFLAGMMLAETEYRHQVESAVRPFRELLLGLFFISVGMLLDLRLLYRQFLVVTALVALLG